jgi:ionotropic glutamate receptor
LAWHIWAVFTLIIVSFYTANLAAYLTISRMNEDIHSVEELSRQSKIKYGIVTGGTTERFFKV